MVNIHNSKIYINDLDTAISHTVGMEYLKRKSILLTGATGTIGSFIADMLIQYCQVHNGAMKIYIAGRDPEKLRKLYGTFDEVEIVAYDLNSSITFDMSIDYIIHAAGNAYPAAFNSDPVGTIMGNLTGTYNLLKYGDTHKTKRFLYVSSGEVYGKGDLSLDAFEESYAGFVDTASPRSCYPSSKRTAENLCVSYSSQFGLETVIVRPCHTYGPTITPTDNRANVQFIRNALKYEDIVMKSAGEQMRSYNYVSDCASAILTVLINGQSGEAYNIANSNSKVTIAEFARIVSKVVGTKVVFVNPDAVDIANRTPIAKQVLSSKKLESLGWSGAYTIDIGIKNTIHILQGK